MSNNLSEYFFFSGIVNTTTIVFEGIDCNEVRLKGDNLKINYKGECVWEIIPTIEQDSPFVKVDFFSSDTLLTSTELFCLSPPKGDLYLIGWKDPHPQNLRFPRVEIFLDRNHFVDCETRAKIREDKVADVLSYKITYAELLIVILGEEVVNKVVRSEEDLNTELQKYLSSEVLDGKIILNHTRYQGTDQIEHKIKQVEFKL